MNFWKVILATIVIYGAGVMSGGLLVKQVDHSHFRNPRRPETPAASGSSISQTNGQGQVTSKSARLPEILSAQELQGLFAAAEDVAGAVSATGAVPGGGGGGGGGYGTTYGAGCNGARGAVRVYYAK